MKKMIAMSAAFMLLGLVGIGSVSACNGGCGDCPHPCPHQGTGGK